MKKGSDGDEEGWHLLETKSRGLKELQGTYVTRESGYSETCTRQPFRTHFHQWFRDYLALLPGPPKLRHVSPPVVIMIQVFPLLTSVSNVNHNEQRERGREAPGSGLVYFV